MRFGVRSAIKLTQTYRHTHSEGEHEVSVVHLFLISAWLWATAQQWENTI